MFRVVFSRQKLIKRLRRIPYADKFVRIDLEALASFDDPSIIDLAYTDIGLSSGVSKETNKNRFTELDEKTATIITGIGAQRIHDVGVSSGITSVELYRRLRKLGFEGCFNVSDKFAKFHSSRNAFGKAIYDADGNLLCRYALGIAGDAADTWRFPVSKLLVWMTPERCPEGAEEFLLYHPELMRCIRECGVESIEFDVLHSAMPPSFDFVRCMNLLNLNYFTNSELERGIANLKRSLLPGGVLQIGRTLPDGSNHAGFYRLDGQLTLIDSIGNGSEIDKLVEAA